jgi:ABC-2 type transport system permease protein
VNGTTLRRPGVLWLLRPKLLSKLNRTRTDEGRLFKWGLLGFVGLFFWAFVFGVIYRMLLYFRGTQGIGDLLASKLLGIALLTFLLILLLSNVITALSTFFLSRDMELLAASPVESLKLYGARLTETIVSSSWMVALMVVPLLAAYGVIYRGGWSFLLLAVATMIPYLVIPAVVGTAFTLFLVNVFPARRTRDLLALIGLFSAAGVVVLFRFLRPERLMRPEEFRDLVDFMAVLRTPTSPWLPNEWVTDALMSQLNGFFDWFPFLFLWSTAAAFFVAGAWVHRRFFRAGFSRAQEGAERKEGRVRSVLLDRLLRGATPATRELIAKEIRVFFRDTTQWSQLVLLSVLVVVYVYNIKVLPLYTGEQISFFLINVVSFLNLGLAGFVVAAIAARFVFPAMSLEGRMMWLLRSSPLDVRTLFWAKYWVGTVPLLLVALPLIVITDIILEASTLILVVTTVAMFGITFGITALALGFGALYPNFETDNMAEVPTSFGGLMFMMAAVSYLGGVVMLLAWPIYQFLAAEFRGIEAPSAMPLALGGAGALLLTLAVVYFPLRAGVRRVRTLEL